MNRGRKGERGDDAPAPLRRRQRAASERGTACGVGAPRWASAARPPDVDGKERPFERRTERHPKRQQQGRPHVGGDERHEEAGDDGPH